MKHRRTNLLLVGAVLILSLLAGCAQQRIRDEASTRMRDGDFEAAIQGLQDGVRQYPESTLLRAGLVSTRGEAIARLVTDVAQLRAQGQFDAADRSIKRALVLEPENSRLLNLQSELAMARRQRALFNEALALVDAGKKQQALNIVEGSLRELPRQPELVALQRRLATELRLDKNAGTQRLLAEDRPLSLDFRGAPLSTVLDAITRGSGINFILDRDVRQDSRVTVYLRSVKVDDAIELVTSAHQLARRIIDPQTVLIYPNTPDKVREHQEQVIRVFHLANVEVKSAAAFLRAMLRIREPFIDERANLLAIRETPELVALAERLLTLHDIGDAEVMLEVEILEVKTSRLTELGINFPNSFSLTPLPAAGATGLTVTSLRNINSDRIGVSVAGLLVNLRREVGDFNILANPRIRAKNREKAQILIGDKVPVITSTSTSTGFVAESVNYLDVGLKLDVEPLVAPDDEVTIKLALEVSSLAKEVRTAAGSLAYQIGTRNVKTTLRLRDGETQVLAGLISNEDRTTSNRVPGLGDLPIAGRLFSSQKDDLQRTELVLAITPRILRSAPHPDLAQTELWIGTELTTRLRAGPSGQATAPVSFAPQSLTPNALIEAAGTTAHGPVRAQWEAPIESKVGETFNVNVLVASTHSLRGVPLEIAFPPEMLEVVEIQEGPYFKQANGLTSFSHGVNAETGRLSASVSRSDAGGSAGEASMLTLRLKSKAPGSAELRFASFKPFVQGGAVSVADMPVLKLSIK
jgi:general secretion pathway protein D